MLTKKQIVDAIQRMPDDLTVDQVIETLYLLRKIEIGVRQANTGEVVPHEEVVERFLGTRAAVG